MAGENDDILTGTELDDLEEVKTPEPKPEDQEVTTEEDDQSGETEELVEEEEPQPEPKKQSRAESRIVKLAEDRARAEERAEQLQRQLEQVLRAQTEATSRQSEAEEERRLQEMEPAERLAYQQSKQTETLQHQIVRLEFQLRDGQDRSEFQAKALVDPLYARFVGKVEERLASIRAGGQNANREMILKYLVGEAMLEQRSKGAEGGKKKAAQRVASATGKPVSARGDVSSGARSKGKTAEERLDGVQI